MCLIPSMPARPPSVLSPILAALRGIEPPECGCRVEVVPVCTVAGGCERRRAGRVCSCPRWPGQPCKHLLAWMSRRPDQVRLAHNLLTLARIYGGEPQDAWAAALWHLQPRLYADRPLPSAPARAVTREDRVALRRLRARLKLSLWRPDDQLQPQEGGADLVAEQEARAAADERKRQKTLEARRLAAQQEAFLAVLHGGRKMP